MLKLTLLNVAIGLALISAQEWETKAICHTSKSTFNGENVVSTYCMRYAFLKNETDTTCDTYSYVWEKRTITPEPVNVPEGTYNTNERCHHTHCKTDAGQQENCDVLIEAGLLAKFRSLPFTNTTLTK